MSNITSSIWHTKKEKPTEDKTIFAQHKSLRDSTIECFMWEKQEFTDAIRKDVIAWCYLDDLLALETELERTRKALDVAVDALKSAHKYYQNCVIREKQPHEINWYCTAMNMDNDIFKALEQITALEQKE